jgi:hypothetical protein
MKSLHLLIILGILAFIALAVFLTENWLKAKGKRVWNIPGLTFVSNHWRLLALTVAAYWLCLDERAFHVAGALTYAPVLILGGVSALLFIWHIAFPSTFEKYIQENKFTEEFWALEARDRVKFFLLAGGAVLIFAAIVLAAVAK